MNQLRQTGGLQRGLRGLGTRWLSSARAGNTGGDAQPPKSNNHVPKNSASTATNPNELKLSEEEYKGREIRPRHAAITNLDRPHPDLLPPVYKLAERASHYQTQMTTLEDGLRVASQTRYGNYSTIGLAINAGSRFEAQFPSGVNHIVEKLGFSASRKFDDRSKLVKLLEEYGGVCDCQVTRDTTIFAISAESRGLPKIMELLGDTVFQPLLIAQELSSARQSVLFEKEDMELRPEKEATLVEMSHATAFGSTTLGLPRQCPEENLELIDGDILLKYFHTYYVPSRMVVSGVGVDHKEMVDLSKTYLKASEAIWNVEDIKNKTIIKPDDSVAVYRGGFNKDERDFGAFNAGPMPVPSLAHIVLGLESVSHRDPEFVTACVLNILMGGGGSFSAGGPGKGMYSRLYTNVLNQLHWVYNATAFNTSYVDAGMFSIYASSPPEHVRNLVLVCLRELAGMAGKITEEELNRSKTQLHSMLLMNLEARPIVFEDIARQILCNGYYKTPDEYIADILKVTADDIHRLAGRMLASPPSVTGLGNLHMLPHLDEITSTLSEMTKSNTKRGGGGRFNLFKTT